MDHKVLLSYLKIHTQNLSNKICFKISKLINLLKKLTMASFRTLRAVGDSLKLHSIY